MARQRFALAATDRESAIDEETIERRVDQWQVRLLDAEEKPCSARRMAESAALLADEVLPERPLRQ
jgi:hypothetical protein